MHTNSLHTTMTLPTSVYLLYDERMTWHRPPGTSVHTEPTCSPELLDEDGKPTVFENSSRIVRLHQTAVNIEKRLTGHDIIWKDPQQQQELNLLSGEDVGGGDDYQRGIQPHYSHFSSNRLWASNPAAPNNVRRFIPLEATPCARTTIELAHTREHYDKSSKPVATRTSNSKPPRTMTIFTFVAIPFSLPHWHVEASSTAWTQSLGI